MPSIVVYKSGQQEATFALDKDIIKIGRASSTHVQLSDISVSRIHAVIERSENGWRVIDLGSTEGTFIEGMRIDQADISVGDTVHIGPFELKIEHTAAPPPPPPPPRPKAAPVAPTAPEPTRPRIQLVDFRCPSCGGSERAASGEIATPFVPVGDFAADRTDALSRLRADVCGACGHISLFVRDPKSFVNQ